VSSTAEIIFGLVKELGAQLTPEVAAALYVGLITDTGRFMYENTDAGSHRMAAELIEAGVDVNDTYRRLYERVPIEKLRLVARALEKLEQVDDCALAITYITAEDYRATGAGEVLTEGIIDYLRALEDASVAALVRDKPDGPTARKVSLRSVNGRVDVSRIAREKGGGGHERAAGFSTDLDYPELVAFLCAEVKAQL
jgi:bifunctional oligoribonuclease and PAP phosphatase NrnA